MSLRARLLGSYLLLLGVTLAVIAGALLLFLFAQPAPAAPTYQKLATIGRELVNELNLAGLSADTRPLLQRLAQGRLLAQLNDFAATNAVRLLGVNMDQQTVLFDTAEKFQRGDPLPLNRQAYALPLYLRRFLPVQSEPVFGSFTDADGSEWLFSGLIVIRQNQERNALLLADPRPPQTWDAVREQFRDNLARPLVQAGLVGVVIAVLLAAIISRNVARPLQQLGDAAAAVAAGDYNRRVPPGGPPEIRAVAEAFNDMSAQVSAARQAQHDFLANVSHDLKTPLTSIQGYSQAIMDGAAKDPAQAAAIIHEEAARLNRMVLQITELARLQAGQLPLQKQPVDMAALAAAVGQRLAIVAQEKGIALHIVTPPVPTISGDGDRLAQVVTNLVSNAIKYTPSGGQVWLRTQVNSGGVEIAVQDTGIGIPPEDLPRVFERFYQVDKTRGPRRGTGLGLAIAQEIVAAHGGRITATSAGPGQGTTFTVWLPAPQVSSASRGRSL
ncbi:MAG: HAMP domain-containing histidine kinase [Chloroflexi bacterium]|nr:HAMP domain-containing histidine kinase [Chloroflexota bacterium]